MEPSDRTPRLFVTPDGKNLFFTFALVSSLFLLWGTCNSMIDVMDKHFQEELHLTLSQSAWVQFAHYLGYCIMSLPAGWLAMKLGYKGGIIAGLLLVAVGGFWFIPATHIAAFWAFLLGVCIIASGLTFLETVANPYTTVLGHERYAATRINLAQSCNGVGWIIGPLIGGVFFYSKDATGQSTGSETLYIPYVTIAVVVLLLAVVFFFANIPDVKATEAAPLEESPDSPWPAHRPIWTRPHFLGAVAAQFFYVAAQAGIFGFFLNYMTSQTPPLPASLGTGFMAGWLETGKNGLLTFTNQGAAGLASVAFMFFLAGRMTGSVILGVASAHLTLGVYAAINIVLCVLVFCKLGWVSVSAVFLLYFFMSIMFPTIFALGIHDLGKGTKIASSLIVMAIMGGALLPKLMGHVADLYDMSRSFIVPLFCFIVIALYAFLWPRLSGSEGLRSVDPRRGH